MRRHDSTIPFLDASGNTQPINPINTNSNIEDCYYVDPYPTMVYYTYSPYTPYKINTSLVKNVGTNKQGKIIQFNIKIALFNTAH
jgi:hypothetical protein